MSWLFIAGEDQEGWETVQKGKYGKLRRSHSGGCHTNYVENLSEILGLTVQFKVYFLGI